MFGAAAMSLSSFCVVTNALRLNWFNLHRAKKTAANAAKNTNTLETDSVVSDKKESQHSAINSTSTSERNDIMTKTLNIEGMMCGHCEARVKKCLEALPEVETAEVSHEAGTAVVTLSGDVADDVLKSTVEAQDYKVTGIR